MVVHLVDLIEQLKAKLEQELTKLIDLDQEIEALVYQRETLFRDVEKLQKALNALNGQTEEDESLGRPDMGVVEEESREAPPVHVSPRGRPEQVDSRPLCNACGGRMEPSFRTLSSGKTVSMLACTDSGCNNEAF